MIHFRLIVVLIALSGISCFDFDLLNGLYNLYDRERIVGDDSTREWNGTIWAVLVAGSNGWYNYRHQADVCHAYQILHSHGIPDSNIIVMMYDDIAHNENNPTPGMVINKPKGRDVYKGVPKDYIGKEVTPKMLLRVLQGDRSLAKQGRKVVKSGPNDHVFLYFSDHGAPGLIAFPSDELYAKDLNTVLKKMSSKKKFAKMAIYIEACESGSMFSGLLPSNINIFATTAANSTESSYACYYDDERETYLGDVYSVNWLEDSDSKTSLRRETLQQQFTVVRKETNTSHVREFGDVSIGRLHVSQFQGSRSVLLSSNQQVNRAPITDAIPSSDVPLSIAQKRLAKSKNKEQHYFNQIKYEQILRSRNFLVNSMKQLLREIGSKLSFESLWNKKQPIVNHDCYINILEKFDEHCFDLSSHPYALRFLYVFVNMCESLEIGASDEDQIINDWMQGLETHCTRHVRGHPFPSIH